MAQQPTQEQRERDPRVMPFRFHGQLRRRAAGRQGCPRMPEAQPRKIVGSLQSGRQLRSRPQHRPSRRGLAAAPASTCAGEAAEAYEQKPAAAAPAAASQADQIKAVQQAPARSTTSRRIVRGLRQAIRKSCCACKPMPPISRRPANPPSGRSRRQQYLKRWKLPHPPPHRPKSRLHRPVPRQHHLRRRPPLRSSRQSPRRSRRAPYARRAGRISCRVVPA